MANSEKVLVVAATFDVSPDGSGFAANALAMFTLGATDSPTAVRVVGVTGKTYSVEDLRLGTS